MTRAALLHRPIFGGLFGMGRYALATLPGISRGLHSVRYVVIDPGPGIVISIADDKVAALANAREVLRATRELENAEAESVCGKDQLRLWPEDQDQHPARPTQRRAVSRRRREIFEKCGGRCHYCHAQLELTAQWHIEHALPRALGGLDEVCNLFAACVACNLAKRDRTALEFVVRS